ncbi:MAG: hypothetical protein HC817_06070 [Saprospiraceae bacterium]|nr:hypothetical protein [Saprospiraceae bacterium]
MLFQLGKVYLSENQDFDTFDRLFFFKKYLNPIYFNIVQAQKKLGVEFYNLTGSFVRAWNDEATSLFDKNFINPRFFQLKNSVILWTNPIAWHLVKCSFLTRF